MQTIDYNRLLDKIYGCWYGKCLGGAAGAPYEGIKKLLDVEDFREMLNPDLPNDDLDIQLLWIDVLKNNGFELNSKILADAWLEKCWYPFSEYGYFMKNYERGIDPPYSGIINNSFFKEGMGCAIRSEIWAVIGAGNPDLAVRYAYLDATLDHSDNAVYAEQFLAAAEAYAFICDDVEEIINKAMEYIPSNSKLASIIKMVEKLWKSGETWQSARKKVLNCCGHPDFTNVVQNMGFIIISILYGAGDMSKTIEISLKCGYDTDCTCASSAAIIGVIKGFSNLGEVNKIINDRFVCGIDVELGTDSIFELSKLTAYLSVIAPNYSIDIINTPFNAKKSRRFLPNMVLPTQEGLNREMAKIKPVKWNVYGPYFEQLDLPMSPKYPSPHGEGSVLPDIVCMVNNQVFLEKEYIDESKMEFEKDDFAGCIHAYEDIVPIEDVIKTEGQLCCYAEAAFFSDEDKMIWIIIGNNDGFCVYVNNEKVIYRDEIRLWTPYNNFELVKLKKGENRIVLKLLRRTEKLVFSIGLRSYNGNHWHRSKWLTKY